MLTWLKQKLGTAADRDRRMSYEQARAALESHASKLREQLAEQEGVEPEILYYLATDASPLIRRKVAANPSTPQQANKLLCGDNDEDVRCELARKIGRLVPGMEDGETSRVRDLAIDVMERLARDSLPRVRAILAEEIRSSTRVPSYIVRQLAMDLELIVCAPVLEYSPLLSDADLIEIVAGAQVEGRATAIARRKQVSEHVSDAIVATMDVSAITVLLSNPNAQIREEALDRIVENAADIESWHQPVVVRADLSLRAVRRIAGFVSSSLLRMLSERGGLDEATVSFLAKRVRERLEAEGVSDNSKSNDDELIAQVQAVHREGKLNDEYMISAAEANNRRLVSIVLAMLAQLPKPVVDRIMVSQSGKAITALVWKAGLGMRVAVKIQTTIARLPSAKLVPARDGVHFPMPADEMSWHLGYFQSQL
jgi:uncharacterized protein (DUF2336 family)